MDLHKIKYVITPTNASILISLLLHLAAPTCFGSNVPSSRSSSVLSELHANVDFG
jgi:hypothetical protein